MNIFFQINSIELLIVSILRALYRLKDEARPLYLAIYLNLDCDQLSQIQEQQVIGGV